MSDELWRWDAVRLADAIRVREISCKEAVSSCLAQLKAVNPQINAVVEVLSDEALALADHADDAIAKQNPIGPLHGVPVTTKINVDQKGCATTHGVVAFANNIATEDSTAVANLRKAGAIIIGRTNAPEFSWRWFTDNELYGETLNPWIRDRTCGGSSGGAAAAVATGICPLAHGTDYGGSIRHPALCCGVMGLRPTFGRVPAYNPNAAEDRPITAQLMAVQGPIARSVRDLRLGLAAMAAQDFRDPWWTPAPLEGKAPAQPIRVALADNIRRPNLDSRIADALERAAGWLSDSGYVVEEIEPPSIDAAAELWRDLVLNDLAHGMVPQIRKLGGAAIRKTAELMIRQAPVLDFPGYLKLLAGRTAVLREWLKFMERYPLILMPVCREPAFELGLDQQDDAAMSRIFDAAAPLLAPAVLGLPCVSVPTGVSDHIPLGVQIVAGRFREDLCLDAAAAIEAHAGPLTPIVPQWTPS